MSFTRYSCTLSMEDNSFGILANFEKDYYPLLFLVSGCCGSVTVVLDELQCCAACGRPTLTPNARTEAIDLAKQDTQALAEWLFPIYGAFGAEVKAYDLARLFEGVTLAIENHHSELLSQTLAGLTKFGLISECSLPEEFSTVVASYLTAGEVPERDVNYGSEGPYTLRINGEKKVLAFAGSQFYQTYEEQS